MNKSIIPFLLCLLAALAGCASNHRAPVSYPEGGGPRFLNDGRVHRVNDGETLYSIAWMYDLDYLELARHNDLAPPYAIQRDQFLRVDVRRDGSRGSGSGTAPTMVATAAGTATGSSARAPAAVTVNPVTITRSSDTRPTATVLPAGSPASTTTIERTPLPEPASVQPITPTRPLAGEGGIATAPPSAPVGALPSANPEPVPMEPPPPVIATRLPDTAAIPPAEAATIPPPGTAVVTPPQAAVVAPPETVFAPSPEVVVSPPPAAPREALPSGPIVWSWPASGPLIGRFSAQGVDNKGIDIGGGRGDDVLAAADGEVVFAGSGLLRYGEMIILKHNDQYLSAYAHNSRLLVREGDRVRRGQKIAELGSTGINREMLHFEIRQEGKPVDPLDYLPPR